MTAVLSIVAPSDKQLAYISDLCEERGLEPPQVIASMQEEREIITRILAREYDPAAYTFDPAFGWTEGPFLRSSPIRPMEATSCSWRVRLWPRTPCRMTASEPDRYADTQADAEREARLDALSAPERPDDGRD